MAANRLGRNRWRVRIEHSVSARLESSRGSHELPGGHWNGLDWLRRCGLLRIWRFGPLEGMVRLVQGSAVHRHMGDDARFAAHLADK